MRMFLIMLVLSAAATGCSDAMKSNYYEMGATFGKHIGDPCKPDVPPNSECGYPPQYYCSSGSVCASACNTDADCQDGSKCMGAGDMSAGECRQPGGMADGPPANQQDGGPSDMAAGGPSDMAGGRG